MTNKEEFKPRVPSIRELVKWHNQFGRMLEPNQKGTILFGIDGKEVEFIERSRPQHFYFRDREEGYEGNLGYSRFKRLDGSESDFRLDCPDGSQGFLTSAECDLVLGSNYPAIDQGYSSPGPRIRKIIFKANQHMAPESYNAFELGTSASHCGEDGGITTDVIYYRIPKQRFRELRDYQTNLASLVEAVRAEREERNAPDNLF